MQALPDNISFVFDGDLYNIKTDFLKDLLSGANMSLYSDDPLGIIDSVGFLKTGEDAKSIVIDLFNKHINQLMEDESEIDIGTLFYDNAMNADSD